MDSMRNRIRADSARLAMIQEERDLAHSQIGQLAYEDAPYILLPSGVPYIVTREELQGVYYNPMLSGAYLWKDLSK